MKPFDIELAKAGHPVCTRAGLPVRILCYDKISNAGYSIVALVYDKGVETVLSYSIDGKRTLDEYESHLDLMMYI